MPKRLLSIVMACVLVLVGCSAPSNNVEQPPQEQALTRKPLNDYSWDELSRISAEISAAEDDGKAREVAARYGLVEDNGRLTDQTKQIVIDGTRALDVRLAGIRHDDRADGVGKVGLTFMTVGALEIRPMNNEATVEGGWEATALRAWLNSEVKTRLDQDLANAIVAVNKYTNNVGITEDTDSVTATSDDLWAFSVHEVCGEVSWDIEEFQQKRGYQDIDGILNHEGQQYEAFAQAGVTSDSDPNHYLSLEASTGPSAWWYRSPYAFEWTQYESTGADGYFYQVMPSGFPKSLGSPEVPAAVVVGFCV